MEFLLMVVRLLFIMGLVQLRQALPKKPQQLPVLHWLLGLLLM